jgi:hypothetical protein
VKKKLTLSVQEELVKYGKQYAAQQGKSLSQVVEEALEKLHAAQEPTFTDKWAGKLVKREHPRGDPRMEYLEKRYE